MTDFKINDLVIIVDNPKSNDMNSHIQMKGMRGFIEEINGEYAQFVELRADGLGGAGGVKLSNLELANDNTELQYLKKERDDQQEVFWQEHMEYSKRCHDRRNAAIEKACKLTGASKEAVIEIFKICEESLGDFY